ncbi:MAG: MFS transporter [Nitrososphaerales archaeon]
MRKTRLRLFILCSSVFLIMLGVGIITPILPLYAESFNAPYFLVGFVISAFGLARLISDMPMGWLADKWGRKLIMQIGMILFATSALIAAYSINIYQLILSRFIQGVGAAMLTTSAMAYIGDIAPINERGKYMGFYQGSFFLGTATGPAIGGFLAEIGGFRAPFITLSILAFIAIIFTQFTVYECLKNNNEEKGYHTYFNEVIKMLRNKSLIVLYSVSVINFIMTAGIRNIAIPLFSVEVIHISKIEVGVILSIAALTSFITIIWSGSALDKFGRKPILVFGFVIAALSCYIFTHANTFFFLILAALAFGFSSGMIQPSQATIMIDKSNLKHRGLSVGLYRTFNDIGIIIGPILVGSLSDHFDLATPFIAVALLCLIASLMSLALLS